MNKNFTAEFVRSLLDYNAETGILTWKRRIDSKRFNTVYAGEQAGTIRPDGYVSISIDSQRNLAHRLAWLITHGEWPPADIDHIDGNPNNNRIVNLRSVSRTENLRNTRRSSNNKSGHNGVHWDKKGRKWQAQTSINNCAVHLGYFDDIDDAIAARKAADIDMHFHPTHGRAS